MGTGISSSVFCAPLLVDSCALLGVHAPRLLPPQCSEKYGWPLITWLLSVTSLRNGHASSGALLEAASALMLSQEFIPRLLRLLEARY